MKELSETSQPKENSELRGDNSYPDCQFVKVEMKRSCQS